VPRISGRDIKAALTFRFTQNKAEIPKQWHDAWQIGDVMLEQGVGVACCSSLHYVGVRKTSVGP
jgi:hypothetical protein